jgi:hypothetical protein
VSNQNKGKNIRGVAQLTPGLMLPVSEGNVSKMLLCVNRKNQHVAFFLNIFNFDKNRILKKIRPLGKYQKGGAMT